MRYLRSRRRRASVWVMAIFAYARAMISWSRIIRTLVSELVDSPCGRHTLNEPTLPLSTCFARLLIAAASSFLDCAASFLVSSVSRFTCLTSLRSCRIRDERLLELSRSSLFVLVMEQFFFKHVKLAHFNFTRKLQQLLGIFYLYKVIYLVKPPGPQCAYVYIRHLSHALFQSEQPYMLIN